MAHNHRDADRDGTFEFRSVLSFPQRFRGGASVGLAVLHDGSLMIADDAGGRIWHVRHRE